MAWWHAVQICDGELVEGLTTFLGRDGKTRVAKTYTPQNGARVVRFWRTGTEGQPRTVSALFRLLPRRVQRVARDAYDAAVARGAAAYAALREACEAAYATAEGKTALDGRDYEAVTGDGTTAGRWTDDGPYDDDGVNVIRGER